MTSFSSLAAKLALAGCAALATGLAAASTVSATRAGSGAGQVGSDNNAIACPGVCSATYADGAVVKLSAVPANGSRFMGWLGPCTGTGLCQFTVQGDTSVLATFAPAANGPASLDIDGSGSVQPLTDGLLVIRYLFGLTGQSLIGGAVSTGAPRSTAPQIINYFIDISPALDVDGNGKIDPLTDGLMIIRYLFSLRGNALIGNAVGPAATRTTAPAIEAHIQALVTPPAVHALTVIRNGTGAGTVTGAPAGIACGVDCSESYDHGTVVALTATPDANSTFAGWSGACSGSGGCTVTMDQARTVTATFTLKTWTLTVTKAGTGTGTVASAPGIACGVDCNETYVHGAMVALTATPDASSTFAGWSGACSGSGGCTVTMDQARSVTATFTLKTYALTVVKAGTGAGTVTGAPAGIACGADCDETYVHGTVAMLTAAADGNSTFVGWSGACTGSGGCSVTMDAAKSVTATFDRLTCDAGLVSNSSDATHYAKALELCPTTTEAGTAPGLISATLSLASGTGTPDVRSRALRGTFGTANVPTAGVSMVVLSTGAAAAPGQTNPNFVAFQDTVGSAGGGLNTGTSSAAPADWLAANNGAFPAAPGCPGAAGTTAYNPVMLTLRLRVPPEAHAFSLAARFFTSEYPEYVCSQYNDVFVALLDSGFAGVPANPADKNLAKSSTLSNALFPMGANLVLAGTGLFNQCLNGTMACQSGGGTSTSSTCTGTSALLGTGMDTAAPGKCQANSIVGGGTDWLAIRGNVVPGEIITLRLAIWDTSDGLVDSLILLDNFRWLPANVTPGLTLLQ